MRKIITLLCLLAAAASLSCAGPGQTIKTWTGSFAGCEKADLGQLVQSGDLQVALLQDVANLIEGDAASLEADLTQLAEGVGLEAVHCAILAVEAVLSPAAGIANATPSALPRGLVRAKAWLATQKAGAQAQAPAHVQGAK